MTDKPFNFSIIIYTFIGEHLTEADLVEHLMTLLGCCENPEIDGVYVEKPDDVLLNDIPPLISAQEFVEEIVGLSN